MKSFRYFLSCFSCFAANLVGIFNSFSTRSTLAICFCFRFIRFWNQILTLAPSVLLRFNLLNRNTFFIHQVCAVIPPPRWRWSRWTISWKRKRGRSTFSEPRIFLSTKSPHGRKSSNAVFEKKRVCLSWVQNINSFFFGLFNFFLNSCSYFGRRKGRFPVEIYDVIHQS